MFKKIMIPVDLKHAARLRKALRVAADLAHSYGAEAHLVGVTMSSPTDVAPSPAVFSEKLEAFAADRSTELGVPFLAHTEVSHDIAADLDEILKRTVEDIGADLVVMASHAPGLAEHVFASNAGYLASHADISVFVVR